MNYSTFLIGERKPARPNHNAATGVFVARKAQHYDWCAGRAC